MAECVDLQAQVESLWVEHDWNVSRADGLRDELVGKAAEMERAEGTKAAALA